MKFNADQLDFLMSKMTISDIDAFNAEAVAFKSAKSLEECCNGVKKNGDRCSKRGKYDGLCASHRVDKPLVVVADADKCNGVKKDGNRCGMKGKFDGMCAKHRPKVLAVLSEEIVVESDTGSGSD